MKILIAYYSHSGNTHRAASLIQRETGGDLYEIVERDAYPREYGVVVKQAKQEIRSGYQPPLQGKLPDISKYDTVFIGSPNWWSTIVPPVATFLSALDFTGKRIIPFITHGGGGLNHTVEDIRTLCKTASVEDGFDANQDRRIPAMVKSFVL